MAGAFRRRLSSTRASPRIPHPSQQEYDLAAAERGPAVSEIFEREKEPASFEEFLDAFPRSGAAAVVLEGDAGVGKTTLFQAGLRSALKRQYRVLASRPAASEVQLSYAALSDLLEGVWPDVAFATVSTAPESFATVAAELNGGGANEPQASVELSTPV